MDIDYKKLDFNDLRKLNELLDIYKEVFEMKNFIMPTPSYLLSLLSNEQIIFFTALTGETVVGGLTAYILPSVYISASEVYIYDLAVKTQFQRKGIGSGLINALKDYCRLLSVREIFVQADLEDKHALEFYKATGGVSEDVVHFSYKL